ncbi:MAG TPA: PP2C family serine/threonine-protein phosphatase [Pyrinomonadaceae bacterium]|jgi:protein phosphatase
MENNFQIASAAVSDRGLSEKRPHNEDSYLELKQHGLFVVADGVGGAQAGDVASQMAVEILGEAFLNMRGGSDAEDIMKAGIEKANSAIFQMSHDLPQLSTMATTIVALHLSGNIATIGHVGDSRLYRFDQTGNLYRETQDHSVVEEEVRAGRMTAAQAANHPSKNVISRALGAEPFVEVDMKTIMFEPDSMFLLCSDGITRHVDDYEIRDVLLSNMNPADICAQLKNICYQRGAEDNLTAVIVKVTSEAARNYALPNRFGDFEEATIATARQAQINTSVAAGNHSDTDDFPTQDLKFPAKEQPKREDLDDPLENYPLETAQTKNYNAEIIENKNNVRPVPEDAQTSDINQEEVETDVKEYRIDEKNGKGFFGKILGSLLLLLAGTVIGLGIYHYLIGVTPPPPPPAPQITEMKTPNIPFSAFEENRRNVDRDPQQFISANAAAPQDAVDFYLLGRAYLLTANYPEAKRAFNESKNRLAQTDNINSKTLANEIAMAEAIISNPFSQEAFEKEMSRYNGSVNSANIENSNLMNRNAAPLR